MTILFWFRGSIFTTIYYNEELQIVKVRYIQRTKFQYLKNRYRGFHLLMQQVIMETIKD